jgi:formylglycine-generating enzyme required for sulfatase activity
MGRNGATADQAPAHRVVLEGFWLSRCEISNAQFQAYLAASGQAAPGLWADMAEKNGPQAPALGVSFQDAQGFCAWAGGRLPTEEEWEYAARGPDQRLYPWGPQFSATACPLGGEQPLAVDSLPEGASWVGCLHMAGNAWEWTDSWYQAYPQSRSGRPEYGQKYRVLRGGHWQFQSPEFVQSCARSWSLSVARLPQAGFRIVKLGL